MDHRQLQYLCERTFHVVDRMKVLSITLLHMIRLEHSPIKIHLKVSMEEKTSALMVSTRMYEDFCNLQETNKVTHSINHQILLVKHEV